MHAAKICGAPNCAEFVPCPTHRVEPWQRTDQRSPVSGSKQQQRARYVIERDETICHVCGLPGANEADHIIPLSQGGADDESNMGAIHAQPCHADKTKLEAAQGRKQSR